MRLETAVLLAMFAVGAAIAQDSPVWIQAEDAWRDKGETKMVCGQVVDSSWASSTVNAPTYLYLERPRPEQVFTVVIPAASRELFGDSPEKSFRGKRICVTGKIASDGTDGAVDRKRRAQVVVDEEEQIVVG